MLTSRARREAVQMRYYERQQKEIKDCGDTDANALMGPLVKQGLGEHDELVAGPSGLGYAFPTTWPAPLRESFAAATAGCGATSAPVARCRSQDMMPCGGRIAHCRIEQTAALSTFWATY